MENIFDALLKQLANFLGSIAPASLRQYLASCLEFRRPVPRLCTQYVGVLRFRDDTTADIELQIPKPSFSFKGTITTSQKREPTREYSLRGSCRFDMVTFEFRSKEPSRLMSGVGTFHIQRDNGCLSGYLVYRHDTLDHVNTIKCELRAIDTRANHGRRQGALSSIIFHGFGHRRLSCEKNHAEFMKPEVLQSSVRDADHKDRGVRSVRFSDLPVIAHSSLEGGDSRFAYYPFHMLYDWRDETMIKEIMDWVTNRMSNFVDSLSPSLAGCRSAPLLEYAGPVCLHTRYSGVLRLLDRPGTYLDFRIPKPGARIVGTMTTREEGKPTCEYSLRGLYRLGILTFDLCAADPTRSFAGFGTLRTERDNRQVKVFLAYRPNNCDEIHTVTCALAANDQAGIAWH